MDFALDLGKQVGQRTCTKV